MKKGIIAIIIVLIAPFNIIAQEEHHHKHNEIGIGNNAVYFLKEKNLSYGFHVHYLRALHESPFSIGIGYERILDEHRHNTIGLVGAIRLFEPVLISFSPGIAFEDHHSDELHFTMHLEGLYEFELGALHIGPTIELAWEPEDVHLSFGIHLGIGF